MQLDITSYRKSTLPKSAKTTHVGMHSHGKTLPPGKGMYATRYKGSPTLVITHSSATGLEDSLRQKINVQIENFRASVQQTICQEFDLHRHSVAIPGIPGRPPVPSSDTGASYYQVY